MYIVLNLIYIYYCRKTFGRYGDLIQQYEVSLSRMLNDILILDQQWLPNPIRLSTNFMTLIPSLTFTDYEWFPWSICNGCGMPAGNAYPSGHLVPSPFWDLLMLQLLRPNSSNLPCLYSTFHLEYPLVLSRFCLGEHCGIQIAIDYEMKFKNYFTSSFWLNLFEFIVRYVYIIYL